MTTTDIAASSGMLTSAGGKTYGQARSTLTRDLKERFILGILMVCGAITISVTLLIVFILARETLGFFDGVTDVQGNVSKISLADFLFDLRWNPLLGEVKHFGIWPLVVGTLQVTFVAMVVAIPVGLLVAIWLSEYAPLRFARFLSRSSK